MAGTSLAKLAEKAIADLAEISVTDATRLSTHESQDFINVRYGHIISLLVLLVKSIMSGVRPFDQAQSPDRTWTDGGLAWIFGHWRTPSESLH
jgi:hypothetical protein